jgi:hypothetical protein
MDGKILLFGIILLFFISSRTLDSYSSPQNNIELNHVSSYVDENRIMHVFGGKILNEYKRSAELRTINPGFVSPFEILFIDQKNVDKIKDFKLNVNGTDARTQPVDLQIKIDSSRQDILGFYYINGVIFNSGPSSANNSIAIATLYDMDGRVIAIGRGLAEPKDISSNSGASFGLAIVDKLQTPKGDRFSVVADSDEYVSKPTKTKEK